MFEERNAGFDKLVPLPKVGSAGPSEPVAIFVCLNGTREAVEKPITYTELATSIRGTIWEQERLGQELREANRRIVEQQRKKRTPAGKLYSRAEKRQMLVETKQVGNQLADALKSVKEQKRRIVEEAGWVLVSRREDPLTVRISPHGRKSELISGIPLGDPDEIAWRVCVTEVAPELWEHPQAGLARQYFVLRREEALGSKSEAEAAEAKLKTFREQHGQSIPEELGPVLQRISEFAKKPLLPELEILRRECR